MRDMAVRMWRKKSYDDVKLQIQINIIIHRLGFNRGSLRPFFSPLRDNPAIGTVCVGSQYGTAYTTTYNRYCQSPLRGDRSP